MSIADFSDTRDVITAAATAEVPGDKPPICGTVTLHCVDDGEPLRLSMPMLDALLLLNSLRAIEKEFALQVWAAQIGCSLNAVDYMSAQIQQQLEEDLNVPPSALN